MVKIIRKISLSLLLLGLLFSYSEAADPALPEVMVGQPRVWYGAAAPYTYVYGGFSGSEAVYNYQNDPGQTMGERLAPSLSLSGTTNSYIDVGTGPVITGQGDFSVSLWFKRNGPNQANDWQMLATQIGIPHMSNFKLQFNHTTNKIHFSIFGTSDGVSCGGAGIPEFEVISSTSINGTDTKWHHVVAQRVNQGGGVTKGQLWQDNIKVAESGASTGIVYLNTPTPTCSGYVDATKSRVGIGSTPESVRSGSNPANSFKGNIDETRIYTKSLTSTEISRLYKGTETAEDNLSSNGLRAYWKFNEGAGSQVLDSSGNNYTGNAINTTWNANEGASPVDSTKYDNMGYDLFGFDTTALADCINGIILGRDRCFVSNSSMSNIVVMNSRTYINDNPATEVAALLSPPKPLIAGDAYLGALLDPNNFAYWGKNLTERRSAGTSPNAYWGIGSYANILASDIPKYEEKINIALKSAKSITSLPNSMGLQGSGDMSDISSEADKYPNGKVWSMSAPGGQTNFGSPRTYIGKGTLIIKNNVCFGYAAPNCNASNYTWKKRVDGNTNDYQMGIIVQGNVNIASGSTIEAAIFCTGTMTVGDNVTLRGSFVAQQFLFSGTGSGTKFIYDESLNKNTPPIFGELNMPNPTEN